VTRNCRGGEACLDVEPVAAAELQALVAEIARTPAEDIAAIQAAHTTGKFFTAKRS
jgi:hypothetical protein